MDKDTGRVAAQPGSREPSPAVSAASGFDPSRGVRPADFIDAYREQVCKVGGGETCCRYLTMGAGGWSCAKRTDMRYTIDSRAAGMLAKGDNCDGVYDALPAFVLLRDRFEHKAGTIIYRAKSYDYGCASDDGALTGKPHTSMTLEPSGDYPFFTVPDEDFSPASGIAARSDETPQAAQPEGQEPDPKGDAQKVSS